MPDAPEEHDGKVGIGGRAITNLDPVVQNNVSLTSSLRGQLVKCFTT